MIAAETELERKEATLRAIVRELESCVVAFSGGVDSALMLAVASQELGERAIGITARSESLAEREYDGALDFAAKIDAEHAVVRTNELANPAYAANPENRCYYCKHELYGTLVEIARERGARFVVDGFNLDDEGDWRPGRKAAKEFGVRSPLNEASFRKEDVRALARKLDLELWDKPALACLSSRFPYGTAITLELLRQVDRAARPWPLGRFVDAAQVALAEESAVFDARAADRYAHGGPVDPRPGHIPGALNAPWSGNLGDDGRFRTPAQLRERFAAAADRPAIAYCGSGVTACHDLLAMHLAGLDRTALYPGSWSQWGADEARPAETS